MTFRLAACAYRRGQYSLCMELAERAYDQAAYEGNPSMLIWSSFLLGSCACNRFDMEQAKRYYDRVLALARGYRTDMRSYIDYNLGSTYLEIGDDARALCHLARAQELDGEEWHNTLLYQKRAILYQRLGRIEEGREQLALAQERFASREWPARSRPELMEQMLEFARLLLEAGEDSPEFERIARALYDDAGDWFGYGFRVFYGQYLVALCKRQRRYKEALALQEGMSRPDVG